MKVLLLAPSKSIHTHKWALFYQQNGIQVKVVTFFDHYSKENAQEVETIVLPKRLPGKLSYLSGVFTLKKILREFKPDILHAHYVSSYGFIGALANFHPFYVSVWGRDIFQFPNQSLLNKKIVQYTLGQADEICSTSHVMAKETNKHINSKVHVTPFGVDMSKFKPDLQSKQNQNDFIIGTVKALSDKYGIADLIKAFSIVHQKYSHTKLLIVGDGPQRKEYEQLVESLNLEHVTSFTGRVPNDQVPEYINKMNVFCVPSTEDSESFGVAAVEAMACSVPVVVSNVGGLPEVVIEGVTGYVVPKENYTELANAITNLIENEDKRIEMGNKGVEHVRQQYNWIDNANGMLQLYADTLRKDDGA